MSRVGARGSFSRTRAGRILLAAVGALWIWRVAATTLAAWLAHDAPDFALWLSPGSSDALVWRTEQALGQDPQAPLESIPALETPKALAESAALLAQGVAAPMVSPDLPPAEREARRRDVARAWANAPLDARAPRLLAQLADAPDATRALMRESLRLSQHEDLARYWLLQDAFVRRDAARQIELADGYLRGQPSAYQLVIPFIANLVVGDDAPLLLRALQANPPWRHLALGQLPESVRDPRSVLGLLIELKQGPTPPTLGERNAFVSYLARTRQFALARQALEALTDEPDRTVGLGLFDGGFRRSRSPSPFAWKMTFADGVSLRFAPAPGLADKNALDLQFMGRTVDDFGIAQLMLLPAGRYVLTGRQNGHLLARRALRWSVTCVETPHTPLAHSDRLSGGETWTDFRFGFEVPGHDCEGQQLSLALDAVSISERIVSGELYLTDLALERAAP